MTVFISILSVLVLIGSFCFAIGEFTLGSALLGAVVISLGAALWSNRRPATTTKTDWMGEATIGFISLIIGLMLLCGSFYYSRETTLFSVILTAFAVWYLIDISRRKGMVAGLVWFSLGLSMLGSFVPILKTGFGLTFILLFCGLLYAFVAFTRSALALRQSQTV